MVSCSQSLRPSIYADVRYIDDVIAIEVLCVFFCVIGIALFGTFVGFLADSFGEVLEARGERREASKNGDAGTAAAAPPAAANVGSDGDGR